MDELANILKNLSIAATEGHLDLDSLVSIKQCLKKTEDDDDKAQCIDVLIKEGVTEKLVNVFQEKDKDVSQEYEITCLQVVAEISKIALGRKEFTSWAFITAILNRLSSKAILNSLSADDIVMILETIRPLANICAENDDARHIVYEKKGIEIVIQMIKNMEGYEFPGKSAAVLFGTVLNLTYSDGDIQKEALNSGLLDIILQYLKKYAPKAKDDGTDGVVPCAYTLSSLSETESCQAQIMEEQFLNVLKDIIQTSTNDDVIDAVFEVFKNLCTDDAFKLGLAKAGLCETLIEVVKCRSDNQDPPSNKVNVRKLAADLVTLILTGDDSMEYLFEGGKGKVYHGCLSWLNCNEKEMQTAGILAAANFARCEENCVQMMQDKVGEQLVSILKMHSHECDDIILQHAVLSALKNLAIPMRNKAPLIETSLVCILKEMAKIETFPIVYKLLGTLRMVIDNQEITARDLGMSETFIKRVVHWSVTVDHPGVKGEAVRLLTKIVNTSKCKDVCRNMLSWGALPPILSTLCAEYAIMRTEAISAIGFFATLCLKKLEEEIDLNDLTKGLVYNFQSGDELADTTLNFMGKLMESDKLYNAFKSPDVITEVEKIKYGPIEVKNGKVVDAILALKSD